MNQSRVVVGQMNQMVVEGYGLIKTDRNASGFLKQSRTGNKIEPYIAPLKQGRNFACKCGSGKKFKNCCGRLK